MSGVPHSRKNRPSLDDEELPVGSFEPTDKRHWSARETSSEALASDSLSAHDSIDWHVTDDWPEQVPITSNEVEVIECFLKQILDDLLK